MLKKLKRWKQQREVKKSSNSENKPKSRKRVIPLSKNFILSGPDSFRLLFYTLQGKGYKYKPYRKEPHLQNKTEHHGLKNEMAFKTEFHGQRYDSHNSDSVEKELSKRLKHRFHLDQNVCKKKHGELSNFTGNARNAAHSCPSIVECLGYETRRAELPLKRARQIREEFNPKHNSADSVINSTRWHVNSFYGNIQKILKKSPKHARDDQKGFNSFPYSKTELDRPDNVLEKNNCTSNKGILVLQSGPHAPTDCNTLVSNISENNILRNIQHTLEPTRTIANGLDKHNDEISSRKTASAEHHDRIQRQITERMDYQYDPKSINSSTLSLHSGEAVTSNHSQGSTIHDGYFPNSNHEPANNAELKEECKNEIRGNFLKNGRPDELVQKKRVIDENDVSDVHLSQSSLSLSSDEEIVGVFGSMTRDVSIPEEETKLQVEIHDSNERYSRYIDIPKQITTGEKDNGSFDSSCFDEIPFQEHEEQDALRPLQEHVKKGTQQQPTTTEMEYEENKDNLQNVASNAIKNEQEDESSNVYLLEHRCLPDENPAEKNSLVNEIIESKQDSEIPLAVQYHASSYFAKNDFLETEEKLLMVVNENQHEAISISPSLELMEVNKLTITEKPGTMISENEIVVLGEQNSCNERVDNNTTAIEDTPSNFAVDICNRTDISSFRNDPLIYEENQTLDKDPNLKEDSSSQDHTFDFSRCPIVGKSDRNSINDKRISFLNQILENGQKVPQVLTNLDSNNLQSESASGSKPSLVSTAFNKALSTEQFNQNSDTPILSQNSEFGKELQKTDDKQTTYLNASTGNERIPLVSIYSDRHKLKRKSDTEAELLEPKQLMFTVCEPSSIPLQTEPISNDDLFANSGELPSKHIESASEELLLEQTLNKEEALIEETPTESNKTANHPHNQIHKREYKEMFEEQDITLSDELQILNSESYSDNKKESIRVNFLKFQSPDDEFHKHQSGTNSMANNNEELSNSSSFQENIFSSSSQAEAELTDNKVASLTESIHLRKTEPLPIVNEPKENHFPVSAPEDAGAPLKKASGTVDFSSPKSQYPNVEEPVDLVTSAPAYPASDLFTDTLISKLVARMRHRALLDKWTETYPWSVDSRPLHKDIEHHLWKTNVNDETQKRVELSDIFSSMNPGLKVLIEGEQGFGKTTLCSVLFSRWALNLPPMQHFTLCLKYHLDELDLASGSISECILKKCKEVLSSEVDDNDIKEAIFEISEKVILILDGFDQVSQEIKESVYYHFKQDYVFQMSTFVATARSITEFEGNPFNSIINIRGFHYSFFMHQLDLTEEVSRSKYHRIHYLEGLSPLISYFILESFKSGTFEHTTEVKLFDILTKTFDLVFFGLSKDCTIETAKETLYFKTGKLFYEALVRGFLQFDENLLKKTIGKDVDFLIKCHVLIRNPRNTERNLFYSNHLLMVFLAATFLRQLLSSRRLENAVERFMQNTLCLGDSSGDYVFGDTVNESSLYFVGLLPEIVLTFQAEDSFADKSIDIIYDVDPVHYSSAFDSVNLLLRINSQLVGRFQFEEISDEDENEGDEQTQSVFSDVLNSLCFDNCTVNYKFYFNRYEEKSFLKVVVDDPEMEIAVLRSAFRARLGSKVERIHLDFKFQYLERLLEFITAAIASAVHGFEMSGACSGCSDPGTFFCQLCTAVLESNTQKTLVLKCGGEDESECPSNYVFSLTISRHSDNIQTHCSCYDIMETFREIKLFGHQSSGSSFSDYKDDICNVINSNCQSENDTFISIDVM